MRNMRIVYACDDNYAALTAVSAVSLLRHNPDAEIILVGCRLRRSSIDLVQSRIEKAGGAFRYVDVSPKIDELEKLGASSYVSYAVYSRIFIADLLPEDTGNILYLDCDTLVADSLSELFKTDMGGNPIALAPDVVHLAYKRVISLPQEKPYYNTGVALINLDAWRRSRCAERLMDELRAPHGRNPLGDQDIIVRILNDEIVPLERRWNFLSQYFLLRCKEKPSIYHFSGNTLGRPWYTSSKHPMRETYRRAAADAGLAEAAEQTRPMPLEYKVQYWLWRILPRALFVPVCNLMYRAHIKLTYGV